LTVQFSEYDITTSEPTVKILDTLQLTQLSVERFMERIFRLYEQEPPHKRVRRLGVVCGKMEQVDKVHAT